MKRESQRDRWPHFTCASPTPLGLVRYKWGAKTEEENFSITWDNNRLRLTISPATNDAEPPKKQKHNVAFLNAVLRKDRVFRPWVQ